MNIHVNLGKESYDIVVERGALQRVASYLSLDRRVLVVTDSGVPAAYADTVCAACKMPVKLVIPAGETSKNMESFMLLLRTMLEHSFTRGDAVVAVGGGVVGDLSGFAASAYMRGIDFYNIPTTLLSEVDSSVGGKTAVDFCGVKNIVGSFYQPRAVLIDPDTLATLDERQFRAGLAEIIKMSATFDTALFEAIEESRDLRADIDGIICRALTIKRDVVEADVKEKGLRRVLNFGHTVGHAIESASGGALLHGECVAMGMLPMCAPPVRERLLALLRRQSFATEITATKEELLSFMIHDKKSAGDRICAVYCEALGSFTVREVTAEEILENL